jgi:hypothetical protein
MQRGIDFACGVWSRQQEKAWRGHRKQPRSRKWRTMSVSGKEGGEKVAHFDSQDSPQILEITAPKPYESGSKVSGLSKASSNGFLPWRFRGKKVSLSSSQ